MLKFDTVLNSTSALAKKYENVSRLSGENFNIFKILKIQSSEVRLHSAFLAELLNPKGSHGQKDIFLKLFTDRFRFKSADFHTENATVNIEKHTGFISEDKTTGGRIDILITDGKKNQFIIENKIYAGDQENQLVRYFNHNPEAHLLYLCLFGGEVSKISCGDLTDKDFRVISYEKDIKEWLIDCRKEAVDHPIVRESITQYINLIKYLTGQSTNNIMNKELAKMLTSSYDKLDAAFTIANALDDACESLLVDLETIVSEIAGELQLQYVFEINFSKKHHGFFFWKTDWQLVSIGFNFENHDQDFIYGIVRDTPCTDPNDKLSSDIKGAIAGSFVGEYSDWWPIHKRMEDPYLNWTDANKEPWLAIVSGAIKPILKDKVLELLPLIENIKGL